METGQLSAHAAECEEHAEDARSGALRCPGCGDRLELWALCPSLAADAGIGYRGIIDPRIQGCRCCGGSWVDQATFDALIAEASSRAPSDSPRRVPQRPMAMDVEVVYRRCPCCTQLMNRRNFAWISGIILDQCPSCGTFFDAGELEGVIQFVRAGGMAVAQAKHRGHRSHPSPLAAILDEPRQLAVGRGAPELMLLVGFLRWIVERLRERDSGSTAR
ncbi:MAG: zf-TFIIB domain-containing protein [Myxococcales bacterium]|nr:zf-TFIIB domain-containing protein [Myxococcales bacterium]